MIIPALVKRYDDLASRQGSGIAPLGYSVQKIGFEIILNKNGTLHEINRVFDSASSTKFKIIKGKKVESVETRERPRELMVPGQAKPSGSGLNPCFLWDNAEYMLGFKPDAPKPERTRKAFEAFRDKHVALRKEIDDEAFTSVCKFLENWTPSAAKKIADLEAIATSFGVFRIRGSHEFVHQRPVVKSWWDTHDSDDDENGDATRGIDQRSDGQPCSLATGKSATIARLHEPKIKGVLGAQTSGATIVSFNQPSFESYGKSQGANAPVGVDDAFKYCTALNQLTTSDAHRVRIGPDTYVFWTEDGPNDEQASSEFASFCADVSMRNSALDGDPGGDESANEALSTDATRPANDDSLRASMSAARSGELFRDIDPDRPFYILGLAPNAARLSVRLWLRSTIGEIRESLRSHAANLAMEPAPDRDQLPSFRRIILETVPPSGGFPDADRVNPTVAADLARSVLTNTPYPRSLFAGVMDRVRCEGLADKETRKDHRDAAWRRCAIIRAYLTRNCQMEVPVALDINRTDPAYLIGRLFAVLERIQEESLQERGGKWKELNRTIKDTYFGSASATPAAIFPRLLKLKNHHANKMDKGLRIAREQDVGSIIDRIESFPSVLGVESQGLFTIGYYHQRQSYFKRTANEPENQSDGSSDADNAR